MSILDHLIVLFIVVLLPVNQLLARGHFPEMLGFSTAQRTRLYYRMVVVQWIGTLALVLAWRGHGRPFTDLGIVVAVDRRFWAAAALAVVSVTGFWLYYRWQLRDENRRRRLRDFADRLAPFLPRTRAALPAFDALAITAGICEEILYRGYFIWYASRFLGTGPLGSATAVLVTSVVFALGHVYQGRRGMLLAFSAGLLHGALYVLAGSLWIAMALHVALDLMGGRLSLELHPEGVTYNEPDSFPG